MPCEAILLNFMPKQDCFVYSACQINKLRIDSDGSDDDALEMHHVEGAFVETVL